MTGFNPDVVTSSINAVKAAYDNLMNAICTNMQSQFVDGMADKWACNQAIKTFASVKSSIDSIIDSSNRTFDSVWNAMNSAAQNWASQTESEWSNVSVSLNETKIDVSGIVENIGGVRGIDKDNAQNVAAKLPGIAEEAKQALDQARNAVDNCGFVGDGQAESLQNSLQTIKTNIDSAVSEITEAINKAVNDTVVSYGDTAGKIAQAFAGN